MPTRARARAFARVGVGVHHYVACVIVCMYLQRGFQELMSGRFGDVEAAVRRLRGDARDSARGLRELTSRRCIFRRHVKLICEDVLCMHVCW